MILPAATQMSDLESLSSAFGSGGSSTNQIASLLGGFLKPVLREQQAVAGPEGVDSLLQELKQSAHSPDQLRQVLGSERMDQMVGQAEQKTGLDANIILRLLPIVLPAIIGLLQSGRPTAASPATGRPDGSTAPRLATGAQARRPGAQTNPILSQFLDSDGDGDVDMQDRRPLDLCLFAQVGGTAIHARVEAESYGLATRCFNDAGRHLDALIASRPGSSVGRFALSLRETFLFLQGWQMRRVFRRRPRTISCVAVILKTGIRGISPKGCATFRLPKSKAFSALFRRPGRTGSVRVAPGHSGAPI